MTNKLFYKVPPRTGVGDQPKDGGGGPHILRVAVKQVKRARKLRREMSLPEVRLWQVLRKRPGGLKFRRQFPRDGMTTDFACLSHRLIVEVDGEGHSCGDQPRRDLARDALLSREGFSVIRIAARDVLGNIDGVLKYIVATCAEIIPPRNGEVAGLRSGTGGGGPTNAAGIQTWAPSTASRSPSPCRGGFGPPPRSGEDFDPRSGEDL